MGISVLAYEFGGNAFSPFPLWTEEICTKFTFTTSASPWCHQGMKFCQTHDSWGFSKT
jgi:hypothetical protein